jgi:hypothetical protein
MQPDVCSCYVEGLATVPAVDPGELFRTVRRQGVMLVVGHGTPPRVHVGS